MSDWDGGGELLDHPLDARDELVYRTVLARGQELTSDAVSEATGLPAVDVEGAVTRLTRAGLLLAVDGAVTAVPPEQRVAALLEDESTRLRDVSQRLESLRTLLPVLSAGPSADRASSWSDIGMEVVEFEHVVPLMRGLATSSTGELLWLRPDQWKIRAGRENDDWVRQLVSGGRASRVIYPARVLEEAPEVIRRRAEVGEHVRVLAEVPARLAVFGISAAVLHERWRENSGRLLVVRQTSVVEAVMELFEHLWDRALSIPGYDGQMPEEYPLSSRRMLLDQLTRGSKDEQIARALGVSLRTVRRRVADLMVELGAESRFQAGVEAVRRGWV